MKKFALAAGMLSLILTSSALAQEYPVLEPSPQQGYDSNYRDNRDPNVRTFDVGIARVAANTYIPANLSQNQGELFLDPGDERVVSMYTAYDIYDSNNQLAVPRNSEIRGRFTPVRGGLKFVADSVVIRGQFYTVQASSDLLPDEKDPREYSAGAIAGDAAIGAGAGALIGALTGGVTWGGVLGGAAASGILGNVTAPRVVVIRPNRPVNIRLDAPLAVRR